MSPESADSVPSRYLRAAGQASDERYEINIDRFIWLVDHSTELGEVRLDLLRDLQSSLTASGDSDTVVEIKDLLTNLIIMETRMSGRNARLKSSHNVSPREFLNSRFSPHARHTPRLRGPAAGLITQ